MGDRCFMRIFCRRQDTEIFEALGFGEIDNTDTPLGTTRDGAELVEMVDEEANYGHTGDLPIKIPWHGMHYEGGEYGSADFYCDGTTLWEWPSGHGGDGYVFPIEEATGKVSRKVTAKFRKFWAHRAKVLAFFATGEPATATA